VAISLHILTWKLPVQAAKIFKEIPDPSSVDRILAAAEALFAEQGFDAVSMSAIAEKAEVSKANIFHHFNSKNALYLAVFGSACRESRARLDMLENNEGNFVERLAHFATGHLQAILEHSNMARLVLRDLLENGADKGKELAEQVFGPNFAKLVEIIRSGQARGELRTDVDPAMVAVMLIAANVYFFEARDMLRHFPDVDFADNPESYSTKMLQLMLYGILPASEEKNS
jgi:TetR/AcrR family transcriptional regulator